MLSGAGPRWSGVRGAALGSDARAGQGFGFWLRPCPASWVGGPREEWTAETPIPSGVGRVPATVLLEQEVLRFT